MRAAREAADSDRVGVTRDSDRVGVTRGREATSRVALDCAGVVASACYVAHCGLTPTVELVAPSWSQQWSHPAAHLLLACAALGASAWALARGGRRWVLALGALGGALLLADASRAAAEFAALAVEPGLRASVPLLGGLCLIGMHLARLGEHAVRPERGNLPRVRGT